jgi:hypothetical protein
MSNKLNPGNSLGVNESITSDDGRFTLIMQGDGNLVLYYNKDGRALWATGTDGHTISQAIMQGDGNFVLYGPEGAIWNAGTYGNPGAWLIVQNDGNVVVYNIDSHPLWNTGTVIESGSLPLRAEQGPDRLATGEWMESKVIFSESGRVDTETSIWTNINMYGFTGGCAAFFLDRNENVLANTPMRSYGVDGKWIPTSPSSRTESEVDDLGQEVFNKTRSIKIVHKLTPKNRLTEDINKGIAIGKTIAEVIAIIAAL